MRKYSENLLKTASKLDAITDGCGEITKYADSIINDNSWEAIIKLLKKIKAVSDNPKYTTIEVKRIADALLSNLYEYYGYTSISEKCSVYNNDSDQRSLDELLAELNELVGLTNVKKKVNDLIVYQQVQKLRESQNLHTSKSTLHLAFTGNPGTGKTTVARIIGRIYKQVGLLSKGHFIEVSRTDLIAGYQGQTALKVKKVIEKAKGGVLFIDEAYSITENDHSDSYGRECLTELTKALEDYREDLVVIVAGYTEPMRVFFESNPGLKSRFNTFIEFDDYTPEELLKILMSICKKNDYKLSDEAQSIIKEAFIQLEEDKKDNFANGRLARNIFDDIVMNHARRVIKNESPKKEELSLILPEDFIKDNII